MYARVEPQHPDSLLHLESSLWTLRQVSVGSKHFTNLENLHAMGLVVDPSVHLLGGLWHARQDMHHIGACKRRRWCWERQSQLGRLGFRLPLQAVLISSIVLVQAHNTKHMPWQPKYMYVSEYTAAWGLLNHKPCVLLGASNAHLSCTPASSCNQKLVGRQLAKCTSRRTVQLLHLDKWKGARYISMFNASVEPDSQTNWLSCNLVTR